MVFISAQYSYQPDLRLLFNLQQRNFTREDTTRSWENQIRIRIRVPPNEKNIKHRYVNFTLGVKNIIAIK